VTPQTRQNSQEGSTAAGASTQDSSATEAHEQGDSASKSEQVAMQLDPSSTALQNLDVRWSERLVLEVPPDSEEDEVSLIYATLSCVLCNLERPLSYVPDNLLFHECTKGLASNFC